MLTKLLKYEWKASYKIVTLMNLFIIVSTAIGILTLITQVWNTESKSISSMGALLFVFYFLSIALVSVTATIYVAVRFYRGMYTDEGYLMHTLPVTKNQLLLSRTIIGTVHIAVTSIVISFSMLLLFYFLATRLDPAARSAIAFELNTGDLSELISIFATNKVMKISLIIFYFVMCAIDSVLLCFASISLGQLFTKHKIISSIICYIGFYTILQIASSFVILPFTGLTLMNKIPLSTILDIGLIVETALIIICNVIFYFISYYILNKKLNLD